jgi:hypothetical protein
VFSFSLYYTRWPACFNTVPKPHTLGSGLYWIVMLSHVVMRVVQHYTLFLFAITLYIIYFLHMLSINHKRTKPCYSSCYSNLLLRRRRWTEILRRGVLGYASPRLPFLWCYGVFRCSVSLRFMLVFKDIIDIIIILYVYDIWLSVSTFDRMCETINSGSYIQ